MMHEDYCAANGPRGLMDSTEVDPWRPAKTVVPWYVLPGIGLVIVAAAVGLCLILR